MLHILAFFAAVCAGCFLLKRRFEQVLPMAVLTAMMVLTILAMVQKLLWVDALAILLLVAILALLAYLLLSKRLSFSDFFYRFARLVFTPGFACTLLLALFYAYAAEPMVVWWRDDIAHWAMSPKSLLAFNGLVDGARHLATPFATYTPGLQVLQWWLVHALGEWRESILYWVLFMSYTVFLLPLCTRLRWKNAWLLPVAFVVLAAFPVWGNVVSYTFLGLDTTLSLCFGYTLIQIWLSREGDNIALLSTALGLCGVILIKQAGLFLALMGMVMLLVTRRVRRKELLCLLSPLLLLCIWSLYCEWMGLSGFHTSSMGDSLRQWLSGTYVPPEGAEGVADALWLSLTKPYFGSITFDTAALLSVPKILLLALAAAFPWLMAKLTGDKALRRISLLFAGMTALYIVVQFVGFFTVFYHETSVYVLAHRENMILLMERYLAPLLLGMGLFDLWLLMESLPKKRSLLAGEIAQNEAYYPISARAAACLCTLTALLLAFTVNWGVILENMIPDRYAQKDRAFGAQEEILMDHDWALALENDPDAHVLLGLELTAEYIRNFRYAFAPTRFELPALSFAENPETLSQYIRENHITHLICFDDTSELFAPAEALADEDGFYPWTLYETVVTSDGVQLVEYINDDDYED